MLKITKNNWRTLVVLFEEDDPLANGMVVYCSDDKYCLGDMHDWNMDHFNEFTGSITIDNNKSIIIE
ncbi:MAG: hypothetical protein N4A59_05635 [Marinifilum sp.]|jgi:hypothetical protein|nr:hypothetical protein [Marinifilum sp.]